MTLIIRDKCLLSPWCLPLRIPLAGIYYILVWLRNTLYDLGWLKTYKIKTPIISVGNLSAGGSGKTIVVQAILKLLLEQHQQVAVLSRGYGRSSSGLLLVANQSTILEPVLRAGDEAYLLALHFPGTPVVVAEDRVAGAQYLEQNFHPDVIILDDGFQHRRLARDLDLLLIDYSRDHKTHLLPWGRLRESSRNQRRAGLVLYTKAGAINDPELAIKFIQAKQALDYQGTTLSLAELPGRDFGLFAGIGNPDHFFEALESVAGTAKHKLRFADHQHYDSSIQQHISELNCPLWITTEKDICKLEPTFIKQNSIYSIGIWATLPAGLITALKRHFN